MYTRYNGNGRWWGRWGVCVMYRVERHVAVPLYGSAKNTTGGYVASAAEGVGKAWYCRSSHHAQNVSVRTALMGGCIGGVMEEAGNAPGGGGQRVLWGGRGKAAGGGRWRRLLPATRGGMWVENEARRSSAPPPAEGREGATACQWRAVSQATHISCHRRWKVSQSLEDG